MIPKDSNIEIRGLSDKHVMANGTITEHQGPLAGIFREGSFGDGLNSTHRFDKIGEEIGFTDRPLSIRDVDYAKIRDDRLKALEMRENETEAFRIARINGTEHKFYCSGKECDDQWGIVGDQVLAVLAALASRARSLHGACALRWLSRSVCSLRRVRALFSTGVGLTWGSCP